MPAAGTLRLRSAMITLETIGFVSPNRAANGSWALATAHLGGLDRVLHPRISPERGRQAHVPCQAELYVLVGPFRGKPGSSMTCPVDLPVVQSNKLELVINHKTASDARPYGAADTARPRRRGDRIGPQMGNRPAAC